MRKERGGLFGTHYLSDSKVAVLHIGAMILKEDGAWFTGKVHFIAVFASLEGFGPFRGIELDLHD